MMNGFGNGSLISLNSSLPDPAFRLKTWFFIPLEVTQLSLDLGVWAYGARPHTQSSAKCVNPDPDYLSG
jgi:hypothetical protein